MAKAEKQLESMVYRLTQENGRWPFLTPMLENATDKAKVTAPPLIKKQEWEFMQNQLEQAERKGLRVRTFVTLNNDMTIHGFWKDRTTGILRTRKSDEILRFLSPCIKVYGQHIRRGEMLFEASIQDLLSVSINLLLALYLVFPRYLFNMGTGYIFSRGVKILRIDGYLTLITIPPLDGTWQYSTA